AQWTAGLLGLALSYVKPAAEPTPRERLTHCSRRREEADASPIPAFPPPHVGGYETRVTGVLLLPLTFPPDVGGVETHLSDLLREIKRRNDLRAHVCTFKPIVTAVREYRRRETDGNVEIRRFWWLGGSFGGNLFRKLEPYPALLFLYITPYFLARALWFMLWHRRQVDVIHVHGLNMAFTGLCLGWLFRKPVIMQTHALYSFQPDSRFGRVARSVLRRMSAVLSLGGASRDELVALGVAADRVTAYRYWIDLERFSSGDKASARQTLGWPSTFAVLFVARLMDIKGTRVVCKLAERFPQLRFVVAGDGPDKPAVLEASRRLPNLHYAGLVQNADLPAFYRAADLTLVPSLYPEGFGRVICESLACGTPVVASRIGGIPDAMDETVGTLCTPDEENFAQALRQMTEDRDRYARCQQNARAYAERRFSAANAEVIFAAYERVRRAN
ncbi:MAG: glycosyltransferase family 4 protein, partial [Verrucomicrobia bacterium]|nr:glycosyltransferase family 4 protein [Verrucomicrobiota bacterium]